MEKKEFYKHRLPHFQQPGQAYFITWILKDAIPPHALKRYTDKLERLKAEIERLGTATGAAVFNRRKNNGFYPHHPESGLKTATPISNTQSPELKKLINEYHTLRKKYIHAYDELLAVTKSGTVDLTKPEIINIGRGNGWKHRLFALCPTMLSTPGAVDCIRRKIIADAIPVCRQGRRDTRSRHQECHRGCSGL